MSVIFDALPGIEVPVSAISKSLAQMWAESAAYGRPAPEADDSKATQLNVVLHLGLNTTAEDAKAQFQVVSAFSKRYPARIVVLCPLHNDVPSLEMHAKVYGECHLGKSKNDKRCVEFVMLSYSRAARPFLENQVSICLSTELPLYYWAHRFSASGRLADYRYLLSKAKRVLIDSAVAPADALTYPWENPAGLRDLVYSRLLPVRQSIGQFLAVYPPNLLADDLKTVTVKHDPGLAAEGRVATCWLQRRLAACGAKPEQVKFVTEPLAKGKGLAIAFEYEGDKKFFRWTGDFAAGDGLFEADLGTGKTKLAAAASLLPPDTALSEAMFF